MNRIVDVYLGLVSLGVVLFWVFNEPTKTADIIHTVGGGTADFITTLQGQ